LLFYVFGIDNFFQNKSNVVKKQTSSFVLNIDGKIINEQKSKANKQILLSHYHEALMGQSPRIKTNQNCLSLSLQTDLTRKQNWKDN